MIKIKEILTKDISFSRKGLPDIKKKEIIGNLSILLKTGINIKDSLDIIINDFSSDKKTTEVLVSMKSELEKGNSLYNAAVLTNSFRKYELFNIKVGEETGQLPTTFFNLTEYLSKRIELKRKIKGALSYPTIVLVTAILAIVFMLNFVVPMFEDIFKRFGQELPYLTRVIIRLSDNSKSILFIMIIIVLFVFIQNKILSNNFKYKKIKSQLILRIPVIGPLTKKINLARFSSAMELFISANIPVYQAIAHIKEMDESFALNIALTKVEEGLIAGENFYDTISSQQYFDKRLAAMIKIGMETNNLQEIFSLSKDNYYDEISHNTSILNSVLEPIMIILVGSIVAIILVAMYLPIFKLSMSFGM